MDYNDEKHWADAGIWKRPDFDVAGYQKALNKLLNVARGGQPIVRLIWSWDSRKWENVSFDEYGNATGGEWRQKYKALTVEIGNGDYVDISPPRWLLEERYEPEQYANSWEQSRYVHDSGECRRCRNISLGLIEQSTSCVRRDVWGAAPRDGWYNALPYIGIIAEHESNKQCCDRVWRDTREICFGRYKLPDQRELDLLRKAVNQRNRDTELNAFSELDEYSLREVRAWGMQDAKDERVRQRDELRQKIKDEVNTHGASVVPPEALVALKDAGRAVPRYKTIFS